MTKLTIAFARRIVVVAAGLMFKDTYDFGQYPSAVIFEELTTEGHSSIVAQGVGIVLTGVAVVRALSLVLYPAVFYIQPKGERLSTPDGVQQMGNTSAKQRP